MRFGTVLTFACAFASLAAVLFLALRHPKATDDGDRCGPGFHAERGRCLFEICPSPLVKDGAGICDAPELKVLIPETQLSIGPSDWEAGGRVQPRIIHVNAFRLDAFEVTAHKFSHDTVDPARAASGVSREEAVAYCIKRGGRLPTWDEWTAAAAGPGGARYPWGETGAVCRRVAFGMVSGPCFQGATGPDTVGARPTGKSPLGLYDMAGNVAEWVEGMTGGAGSGDPEHGLVRGGSYASALATELRTWASAEADPFAKDPRYGFRCAYPPR